MGILEWAATIASLIYLYYAVKNKPICFIYGMIGSAIWAFVSYHSHLLFDTGLQIFYILMSVVGLYTWKFGGNQKSELPITKNSLKHHLLIIIQGAIASFGLIQLSQYSASINLPVLDAITTVFLVIGTILLIQRKLYSWIYLVVADVFYIYIYGKVGLWLFVGVMFVYIIFGLVGFDQWRRTYSDTA